MGNLEENNILFIEEHYFYVLILYILIPITVSWFQLNIKKTSDNFWSFLSYSLIAIMLSPIILKSIGNETLSTFLTKEVYSYFQVCSYLTLISVGGFNLVQKIISDVFGAAEKDRLTNLEKTAKKSIQEKIKPSNINNFDYLLKLISNTNNFKYENIPLDYKDSFEELLKESLIIKNIHLDEYELSALGKIYLSK